MKVIRYTLCPPTLTLPLEGGGMGGGGRRGFLYWFSLLAAFTVLLGCDGMPDGERGSSIAGPAEPIAQQTARQGTTMA